jgi:hypothetical protein
MHCGCDREEETQLGEFDLGRCILTIEGKTVFLRPPGRRIADGGQASELLKEA